MRANVLAVLSVAGGISGFIALSAAGATGLMSWGYLLWLKTRRRDRCREASARQCDPAVDIIVCVHNEAEMIAGKMANLQELRYRPDRLRFWIVDGASTDGTAEVVAGLAALDPRFHLLRERADKTAQLNAALARCTADWVLITDADARLHPETLSALLDAAVSEEGVGAVGTTVEPAASCHGFERIHWRISNRVRRLESLAGCASMVMAPCYLMRRDIVERLPEDVVADDIHAAMAAALHGCRVCFVDAPVTEIRAPRSLAELFRHKLRKMLAYLREIYRFLPALPRMPRPARSVFVWRTVQLTLLPWVAVIGVGAACHAASAAPSAAIAAAGMGILTAVLVGMGGGERGPRSLLAGAALALFLIAVCVTAFVIYPFTQRSACFPKVGVASKPGVLP